jgi:hypothetical protein
MTALFLRRVLVLCEPKIGVIGAWSGTRFSDKVFAKFRAKLATESEAFNGQICAGMLPNQARPAASTAWHRRVVPDRTP